MGFRPPAAAPELRTDGRLHPLHCRAFYAVDRAGRLFMGNADGLSVQPDTSSRMAEEQALRFFGALAASD